MFLHGACRSISLLGQKFICIMYRTISPRGILNPPLLLFHSIYTGVVSFLDAI